MGVLFGVALARDIGLSPVLVESDALSVVSAILEVNRPLFSDDGLVVSHMRTNDRRAHGERAMLRRFGSMWYKLSWKM
ncbi:hypothetical protein ACOSQ3_032422 [Xanthoceras sorbifolium]